MPREYKGDDNLWKRKRLCNHATKRTEYHIIMIKMRIKYMSAHVFANFINKYIMSIWMLHTVTFP